jgi:hypothetical protein
MAAANVEYSRLLYADVLAWYRTADQKAQLILGANGAFVTVITTSAFANEGELEVITSSFGVLTWFLLACMVLAVIGSFVCAFMCLWSRTESPEAVTRFLAQAAVPSERYLHYSPDAMWFFQHVHGLDQRFFEEELVLYDEEKEVRTMAAQVWKLSANVLQKHRWVNYGLILAGTTPLLFMLAFVSYLPSL